MSWIRKYYEKVLNMLWEVERPIHHERYRDHRQEEREAEQTAYEEVLDRFRREHPNGLRFEEAQLQKMECMMRGGMKMEQEDDFDEDELERELNEADDEDGEY